MGLKKNKISTNICIISSCTEDWGGSEELWGKTVPYLVTEGYSVTVYKNRVNINHNAFVSLHELGVDFENIDVVKPFIWRNIDKAYSKVAQIAKKERPFSFIYNPWVNNLIKLLKKNKPSFAIISQGINFDGLAYAYACKSLKIPYVIISQKAVDFYWPSRSDRPMMLEIIREAKACYFVSKHNLSLTEEQFGARLSNGKVIFNPLKVGNLIPYPATDKGFKLACVGRLFLLDKGQDILIRIMDSQLWRDRDVTITFIGKGVDDEGLKEMANLLGVENVFFAGQVEDIDTVWKDYHALVLPSRSEGLPLSMVEAMAAGRPVIVSKAGGNTELIEENITGFSGHPFEETFAEAMERAWGQRHRWEELGKLASKEIGKVVPEVPEREFAAEVIDLIKAEVE